MGATGIIIWMYDPLFSMGKYIVMDSGFCDANGIVELSPKEMYVDALIKKRRNWLKSVPGDIIDRNFVDKDMGYLEILEASIEDGKTLVILCFKNP